MSPNAITTATPTGTSGLTPLQIDTYQSTGHLTVPGALNEAGIARLIDDIGAWSDEVLAAMDAKQRAWYLERGSSTPLLRKLDDPVFHRQAFRDLAASEPLLTYVEQLIGPGVSVYFSQVFMKPPGVGGPKPVHQDNFYFGPNDLDGVITAWIALDEATIENGCLYYGEGTQRGEVYPHIAPPDEPFNLQLPADIAQRFEMTPAPVPAGGVSFHHGNTFHQSSDNRSTKPRRAIALHYVNHHTRFVNPALPYDDSKVVRVQRLAN